MNKKFLNTQIQKLAKRSQKIIIELGGVEQLLDFFDKHKSFLSIPNAGAFTNEDLINLCEYLLSGRYNDDEKQYEKNEKEIDIEKWIYIYENEKPFLNKKLYSILNWLEQKNDFKISLENKVAYFIKYFLGEFNLFNISFIGAKSKLELNALRNKLLNIPTEIEEVQKDKQETLQSKNYIFPIDFNAEERKQLFINGEYSFRKLLCIFLMYTNNIKERTHAILLNSFFGDGHSDKNIFSKELNCSLERVRQIEIQLRETTLPLAIDRIFQSFDSKPYDLPQPGDKNILILDDFPRFVFRGSPIEPNIYFSKIAYSHVLFNSFELIDSFVLKNSKSFNCPNHILFISKNFIRETDFVKLKEWLDEQIYDFESVGFEYRLEVLIKRYFTEMEMCIEENNLRDLNFIILNIKKDNFEINENVLKSIYKKNRVDSVLNEVYLFLKEKDEAQMTNAIIDHLNLKYFKIEKEELLKYLNNHKSTYTPFGLGNWALVEWKNNAESLSGSFREIVKNLMSKRSDPIHISEIYDYLNNLKKVSLHSITSNLKLEAENTFKFFNCSYIGLSDKYYADYWYQLPKIKPVYLRKNTFPQNGYKEEEKINEVCLKYSYPKQHVQFILDCRQGKYI